MSATEDVQAFDRREALREGRELARRRAPAPPVPPGEVIALLRESTQDAEEAAALAVLALYYVLAARRLAEERAWRLARLRERIKAERRILGAIAAGLSLPDDVETVTWAPELLSVAVAVIRAETAVLQLEARGLAVRAPGLERWMAVRDVAVMTAPDLGDEILAIPFVETW